MAVRINHRCANLAEKFQSFTKGETLRIAILVDRNAFDIFHHEIRQPVFGRAAVE